MEVNGKLYYLWRLPITKGRSAVTASGRSFPPREIRRRYKALAGPSPVCSSHLAGLSASSRRVRLQDLHAAKFCFPNAGRLRALDLT